jgi:ankyrin repeat protein
LVLERLPTTSAREAYLNKRRQERGRPTIYRGHHFLGGNIKDYHEDEVADWLSEEEVSNYHTFTVPYGQKFHAKRIEKLCYTRDLLLNAEWNQPKERDVYLHRHPAFFGRVEDVIEDCCGCCPVPKTDEEKEVAAKEAEIYISGKVAFLIDDPGRQQIGSFNPLTEKDWTDMAYVGNTARLCQSIVDGDVDDILNWLSQEEADPNKRDYTGRSPLHLAVMTSTPEVVKCLIDHGARLTARLADGRTALHLAASRGHTEIIKLLMEKSIENEEAEEEKQDRRRQASKALGGESAKASTAPAGDSEDDAEPEASEDADNGSDEDEESDGELIGDEVTDTDHLSTTTGSFVKVKKDQSNEDLVLDESDDEPDYYQIDVLAWDVPCSPLHLAIAGGHEDTVRLLCDYGADSILPIKFLGNSDQDESAAAILTLTLALSLPLEQAKSMAKLLLQLGATSSQADRNGTTAFHRYVESGKVAMVDTLLDNDKTGVKTALNHLVFTGYQWNPKTVGPIHSAVEHGDPILVLKLLNAGASAEIDFETWLKSAKVSPVQSGRLQDLEASKNSFKKMEQPIISAVRVGDPEVAIALLENGADPNSLTSETHELLIHEYRRRWSRGMSVLDLIQKSIDGITSELAKVSSRRKPREVPGIDTFLQKFKPGTYQHWLVSADVAMKKKAFKLEVENYEKAIREEIEGGEQEKRRVLQEIVSGLEKVKRTVVSKGGKTFAQLYPDIKTADDDSRATSSSSRHDDPKPYDYIFTYRHDKDLTEKRRDGYNEL